MRLNPLVPEPVIHTGKRKRQRFAQMTNNELERGAAVMLTEKL
jgi:hypothetical protein